MRLLGDVRRGVEARDRVLGHQEPGEEHVPEDDAPEPGGALTTPAGGVDRVREDRAERPVVVRDEQEDDDDYPDTDHVPVGGDRVEHRRHGHLHEVQHERDEQDDGVRQVDVLLVVRVVEPVVEERCSEDREPVTDSRGDRDLPDEVEPAREPAPAGASELRGPVVEAARGRIGGGDLGHRQRDEGAHEPDEEPAPGHRDGTTLTVRDHVRREASREDRDDGERDREVLEPSHRAEELLRVAQSVEGLLVLRRVVAGRLTSTHVPSQVACRLRRVLRPLPG